MISRGAEMTLRECLAQFCDIQLEIKELEKKIAKLEPKSRDIISDSVETTTKTFPIISTHYKIYGTDHKLNKKIEQYKNVLKERYDKLLDIQVMVEKYINNIPTSRMRRIFEYRYIEQLPWFKIAQKIGGTATEDSIKKEHNRFLQKNKVCPICPEKM